MNFIKLLVPAFLACSCNALANMFWKFRFDKVPLSLKSAGDFWGLISSPYIWIGVIFYGCSMLLFFFMLSNFKLSAMMPVLCMTYILNIVIAKIVFGESIAGMQMLGTAIIIIGLLVLSRVNAAK